MQPEDHRTDSTDLKAQLQQTLAQLDSRQKELAQLNLELEETNRGVVALYAELDEKAEHLKRADELKSKFLSHVSHEFRTPLNAIIGLSRLLLDNLENNLTEEQKKQLQFIFTAAEDLTELVNDLLDLSKIEAGKTQLHLSTFTINGLFGALRGMFRPIATNPAVSLHFEEPLEDFPLLHTDEGKLSQILRNYISNAVKFTEQGEIRVSARIEDPAILFAVSDTGIGIPFEEQHLLFQEFSQLDTFLQKKTKGTGLGLALCRKLAEILEGSVSLQSEPGKGSTFFASIPLRHSMWTNSTIPDATPIRVLIVDDDERSRYLMTNWLSAVELVVSEASSGEDGLVIARGQPLDIIILDLNMPGLSGFDFLNIRSQEPALAKIPVLIHTSQLLNQREEEFLQSHATAIMPKNGITREIAVATVRKHAKR